MIDVKKDEGTTHVRPCHHQTNLLTYTYTHTPHTRKFYCYGCSRLTGKMEVKLENHLQLRPPPNKQQTWTENLSAFRLGARVSRHVVRRVVRHVLLNVLRLTNVTVHTRGTFQRHICGSQSDDIEVSRHVASMNALSVSDSRSTSTAI